MIKLIKKHSGGGWLKDKAGKDRIGYWDYSDSNDPNIQKKIAQYYTLTGNGPSQKAAEDYLDSHPALVRYLDSIYKNGINWKGQAALGNKFDTHHQIYHPYNKSFQVTNKANSYAKDLGYTNYEDLQNALSAAGYSPQGYGVFRKKDKNNEVKSYTLQETPTGLAFVNGDNYVAIVNKDVLDRQAFFKAWNKWDNIAKQYRGSHNGGWFSSAMARRGYKYDSSTGTYKKGNSTIKITPNSVTVNQGNKLKDYTYAAFINDFLNK